jgi:hypothetical protein
MIQSRRQVDLRCEATKDGRAVGDVVPRSFDRDEQAKVAIVGAPDLAGAAEADALEQEVTPRTQVARRESGGDVRPAGKPPRVFADPGEIAMRRLAAREKLVPTSVAGIPATEPSPGTSSAHSAA